MAANFEGKYLYERSENVLEFLKAIGVTDEVIQKQGGKLSNVLEVKVNGSQVTVKSDGDKTFEIGKEFDDKMIDGSVLKSTAKLDGKKMIVSSTKPDGKKGERVYEVTADGLVVTLTAEGCPIVGKRFYKKA